MRDGVEACELENFKHLFSWFQSINVNVEHRVGSWVKKFFLVPIISHCQSTVLIDGRGCDHDPEELALPLKLWEVLPFRSFVRNQSTGMSGSPH